MVLLPGCDTSYKLAVNAPVEAERPATHSEAPLPVPYAARAGTDTGIQHTQKSHNNSEKAWR